MECVPAVAKLPTVKLQSREVAACAAVQWIAATMDLKAIRKKSRAKAAWARLFTKGKAIEAKRLEEAAGNTNYEQLRTWRVRLDITCMVLFRKYLASFVIDDLDIFLYTDGSPQWKGLEMIASTMDMVASGAQNFSNS